MTNVNPAITITCYYPKIPAEDTAQPVTPLTPVFKDIEIKNLTATCPKNAGVIVGLPESLVTNVSLTNVRITAQTGLTIRNAKAVKLKDVKVEVRKGQPIVLNNAGVEGMEPASRP
jgi:polygalacturonase